MDAEEFLVSGEEIETNGEFGIPGSHVGDEAYNMDIPLTTDLEMLEMDTDVADMPGPGNENKGKDAAVFSSEKDDLVSHGNVVFAREAPLVNIENFSTGACNCGAEKFKSRFAATDSQPGKSGRKLSRQDRIELGRLFQGAVSTHDWEVAESLISLADPQTLNDALCTSLDSIWFLTTQELYGITALIKKVIGNGAYDFTRAALRTSFLASCVSACQSRTMSLADTVSVMA